MLPARSRCAPERAGSRRPRPPSRAAAAAVRGVDAIISWGTRTAYFFLSCKVPPRGAMDCNDSSLIGGLAPSVAMRGPARRQTAPALSRRRHHTQAHLRCETSRRDEAARPCLPSRNFIRIGDCPKSWPGRGLLNNRLVRRPNKTGISQRTTSSCTATTFEGSCRPSSSQRCSALVSRPRLTLRRIRDSPFSNRTW